MRENPSAFFRHNPSATGSTLRFNVIWATQRKLSMLALGATLSLLIGCLTNQAFAGSPAATETRAASLRVRTQRDLEVLQTRVQKSVKKALSATLSVQVQRNSEGFAFGSGVIVSEDGYVLTAAHVSGQPNQKVRFFLADGTTANGITLGLHKDLDMGLMKITDKGRKWPHLRRARSSQLEHGDWVIATGHPGVFEQKADSLVRLGRILKITDKVLLTDCPLVGGDSGGPLVDLNGNVIAIHSRIGADLTTNLHVPIDRFADSWNRLAEGDVWGPLVSTKPWIGVEHDRSFSEAYVLKVRPESPASRAGLRMGDKIVRFADNDIKSFTALKRFVSKQDPGDRVTIQFERNGTLIETAMQIEGKQSTEDSPTRDDAALLKDWLEQIDRHRSRGRAVGVGKNADQVKESFHDILEAASEATVEVLKSGTVVALGTIVDKRLILTKASEVDGRRLKCRFRNSRSFKVEKVAELRSHDLALLRASRDLPTVRLRATTIPKPGALLASSGLNVWPLAVGVASAKPVDIPSEGKLGIRMEGDLPKVSRLIPGSGAESAGMRRGDLIAAVDGQQIKTALDLINIVKGRLPGDVLTLSVKRNGVLQEYSVALVRHSDLDEALAEFRDFIGGERSSRRTGFDKVLQHDSVISHRHCGGPVVDINGKFVGINIARAARTSSYLLPASEVRTALKLLKERMATANEALTISVKQ